jgi:hypothetical protein
MKKRFIVLLIFIGSFTSCCQNVGIGSTALNISAQIDITNTHKSQSKRWLGNGSIIKKAIPESEEILQIDLVARNVVLTALEAGYDFIGVGGQKMKMIFMGYCTPRFVAPLITAMQEHQQIELLKQHNNA